MGLLKITVPHEPANCCSLSSLINRLNQHQATPLDKLIAAFDKMAADYDEKAT